MTKDELEKKLFEMINNSEMIINRKDFRTLYFVNEVRKVRKDKLNKLFDSNYLKNTYRKFSECDCFMSIKCSKDCLLIKTNKDIFNDLTHVFECDYYDILNFLKYFFSDNYNLRFNNRDMEFNDYYTDEDKHLDEKTFATKFEYKNPSENKTLAFSFQKYKFDICNFSYKKIVNLFKKK